VAAGDAHATGLVVLGFSCRASMSILSSPVAGEKRYTEPPVGKAWVINGGTYVAVRSAYQEIDQDPERGPDEDGRLEHEPACWSRRPPDSGKTVINLSAIN
jgi:hypothetical protein